MEYQGAVLNCLFNARGGEATVLFFSFSLNVKPPTHPTLMILLTIKTAAYTPPPLLCIKSTIGDSIP